MKQLLLMVFALMLMAVATASAGEMTATFGNGITREDKGLGRQTGEGDELVNKHCTSCHSAARIMTTLQAMHTAKDEHYEKEVKNIIARKIRMTNGEISRQDGRKIMDYLISVWHRQKPQVEVYLPAGGKTSGRLAAAVSSGFQCGAQI